MKSKCVRFDVKSAIFHSECIRNISFRHMCAHICIVKPENEQFIRMKYLRLRQI